MNDQLANAIRDNRCALWLGPLFSEAAGIAMPADVMRKLAAAFLEDLDLDPGKKGMLNAFVEREEWRRVAKLCADHKSDDYQRILRQHFADGPKLRNHRPPYLMQLLARLNFTQVLTNAPDIMAVEAFDDRPVYTWRDPVSIADVVSRRNKSLIYVEGIARDPHTLVFTLDSRRQYDGMGGQFFREQIRRICDHQTILFVGFRGDEAVFAWLEGLLGRSLNTLANMKMLSPSDSDTTLPKAIVYEAAKDEQSVEDQGLLTWFADLAKDLGVPMPVRSDVRNPSEWLEMTGAALNALPKASESEIRNYFKGGALSWPMVRDEIAVPRSQVAKVLGLIDQGRQAVLIDGPSCEGKTTLMKQAATQLLGRGYRVFEAASPLCDPRELLRKERGRLVVLMDNAIQYRGLAPVIQAFHRHGSAILLMTARTHEWRHKFRRAEATLEALPKVTLSGLNHSEAELLFDQLAHYELVIGELSRDAFVAKLTQQQKTFLLALILETVYGKPLHEVLRSVLTELATWSDGEQLIKALATVTAVEALPTKSGIPFGCTKLLFREVLDLAAEAVDALCERLVGEVSLKVEDRITTRDPVIGKALAGILFDPEKPMVSDLETYRDLVWAAGRIAVDLGENYERSLLTIIPRYFEKKNRTEEARILYQTATQADPQNPITWQSWALLEKRLENYGDQLHSARWLFQRATETDPSHAPAWQAWAVMEKERGHVGDLDQPHTARWLFQKATEADPNHAPSWQAWALLEKEQNNVGALDQANTARWLFQKATEADPSDAPSWQAWALMEAEAGHFGSEDQPHSARGLFRQAVRVDPKNIPVWGAWFDAELEQGHREQAQHILEEYRRRYPGAGLHRTWASRLAAPPKEPSQTKPVKTQQSQPEPKHLLNTQEIQTSLSQSRSEWARYLAAKAVVDNPDATLEKVMIALTLITPVARKPVLRKKELPLLKEDPVCMITLTPDQLPKPPGDLRARIFIAKKSGKLTQIDLFNDERDAQTKNLYQIPKHKMRQTSVLGLYWGLATFQTFPHLFLVYGVPGKAQALQFSLAQDDRLPLQVTNLPDWVQQCPVVGPLGVDLLAEGIAETPPDNADYAVWFDNKLLSATRKGAEQRIMASSLCPLDDCLLKIHRDQYIVAFDPQQAEVEQWRWYARREPTTACPLPKQAGQFSSFYVAYETGELVEAMIMPKDWSRDLFDRLETKLVSLASLNHLKDWFQWSDSVLKQPIKGGSRPHWLAAILRTLATRLCRERDLDASLVTKQAQLFHQPLYQAEFIPITSAIRDMLRFWCEQSYPIGANAVLAIYECLPFRQRDVIDNDLKRYFRTQPEWEGSQQGLDIAAFDQLMTRKDQARDQTPSDEPLKQATMYAERWLYGSEPKRGCALRHQKIPTGFMRTIPGQNCFFWVDDQALDIYSTDAQKVYSHQNPHGSPRFCVSGKHKANPYLLIGFEQVILWHYIQQGLVESTHNFSIPEGYDCSLAADAGDGQVFLLLKQRGEYGCQLWLFDLAKERVVATRKFRFKEPHELVVHRIRPKREWLVFCDDTHKSLVCVRLKFDVKAHKRSDEYATLSGFRVSSPKVRPLGSAIRSLATARRSERDWDLLVGTVKGHLFALSLSGASPTLNPRWLNSGCSAIRHIHAVPTGAHHYAVCALTSYGEIWLLNHHGRMRWRRAVNLDFRSGALLKTKDHLYVGACDVRGMFMVFQQFKQYDWKKKLQHLTTDLKDPKIEIPHDEAFAYHCLNDLEQLERHFDSQPLSAKGRACIIKGLGEKIIDRHNDQHQRAFVVFEALAPKLTLDDFETLGRIKYQRGNRSLREKTVRLLIHHLAILADELRQDGSNTLGDRVTRILATLIRGLGRHIITPRWVFENESLWLELPEVLRSRAEVNEAVIRNVARPEVNADQMVYEDLVCQATFLGPAGFEALTLLAPTAQVANAFALSEAMTLLENQRTADYHPPKGADGGLGALILRVIAYLAREKTNWSEAQTLGRDWDKLAKGQAEFEVHPAWLELLRQFQRYHLGEDFRYLSNQEQLAQLNGLLTQSIVDPQHQEGFWGDWMAWAQHLLVKQDDQVLAAQKTAIQTRIRVRLVETHIRTLDPTRVLIGGRLVPDGEGRSDTQVTVRALAEDFTGPEGPLEDYWTWSQLSDHPIQWVGSLKASRNIRLELTTHHPGQTPYRELWRIHIPQHQSHQDVYAGLPKLLEAQTRTLTQFRRGTYLFVYDPALGEQSLLAQLGQDRQFLVMDLDAHLDGATSQGLDAATIARHLGLTPTRDGHWRWSSRGYRGVLFSPCARFLERLSRPKHRLALKELLKILQQVVNAPLCFLAPIDMGLTFHALCEDKVTLRLLYHLLPSQDVRAEIETWLEGELVEGDHLKFGGNLRLLYAWRQGDYTSLDAFFRSETVDELIRQELVALEALDYALLVVLAFGWHEVTFRELRPGMVLHEKSPEGKLWVQGSHQLEQMQTPEPLKPLLHLLLAESEAERQPQFRTLRARGLLASVQDWHMVTPPLRAWLHQEVNVAEGARAFLDAMVDGRFTGHLPFEVMAAAGDDFKILAANLSQQGLRLIQGFAKLFSRDINQDQAAQLIEDMVQEPLKTHDGTTNFAGQKGLYQGLQESVEGCLFELTASGGNQQWLGLTARWREGSLRKVEHLLRQHPRLTLTLIGPGIEKFESELSNLCLLKSHQLKEMVVRVEPHRYFWQAVQTNSGLESLSPFQVGNALPEDSPVFVGREREIEMILSHISKQSFLILGGRQIGKTSLLRHLYGKLKQISTVKPIYLTLEGVTKAEHFLKNLAKALEISVDDGDVLETIEAILSEQKHHVLLLNEVDGLAKYGLDVMGLLRSLSEQGRCQVIMAGYHGAFLATQDPNNALFHWVRGEADTKALILGSLNKEASIKLIEQLEKSRLNLSWENEAVKEAGTNMLLERSYRIPVILQGACQSLVSRLAKKRSFEITMADVQHREGAGAYPVWDYLGKIKFSVLDSKEKTLLEEYWSNLMLAVIVKRLSPDKFELSFESLQVRAWVRHEFDQYKPSLGDYVDKTFKPDHYQMSFENYALTIVMAPDSENHKAYKFSERIYPSELIGYLRRSNLSIEKYIQNQLRAIEEISKTEVSS